MSSASVLTSRPRHHPGQGTCPFTSQVRPIASSSVCTVLILLTPSLCSHRASPKSRTATESPATASGGQPGVAPTPGLGGAATIFPRDGGDWPDSPGLTRETARLGEQAPRGTARLEMPPQLPRACPALPCRPWARRRQVGRGRCFRVFHAV